MCENDTIEVTNHKLPTPKDEYILPPPTSEFSTPSSDNYFPFTQQQHKTMEILQYLTPHQFFSTINQLNLPTSKLKLNDYAIKVQLDGGANTSITNDLSILDHFWKIPEYSGKIPDFFVQMDSNFSLICSKF